MSNLGTLSMALAEAIENKLPCHLIVTVHTATSEPPAYAVTILQLGRFREGGKDITKRFVGIHLTKKTIQREASKVAQNYKKIMGESYAN